MIHPGTLSLEPSIDAVVTINFLVGKSEISHLLVRHSPFPQIGVFTNCNRMSAFEDNPVAQILQLNGQLTSIPHIVCEEHQSITATKDC